jgi:MFS family permease
MAKLSIAVAVPASLLSRRAVQFTLCTLVALSAAYARGALNPLQDALGKALLLSDNQVAVIQGPALALPFLVVTVPLGLAIDRYSRARLLFLFASLQIIGSAMTAIAHTVVALFFARCLIGFTATAIATTVFSLLADLFEEGHRGRASMIVVVGQFAGMASAFALGGVLLKNVGLTHWRLAMGWMTVPLGLVGLMMLAMREPMRTGVALRHPTVRQTGKELWQYRAVITPTLIGIVMAQIAVAAIFTWTAPTLARSFGQPADRIGAILATALMVSGVLGPIGGGLLADYSQRTGGPRRTLTVLSGLGFLSAPIALFAVSGAVTVASILLVVFVTLITAICVIGTVFFTIVVPNELRGISMAVLASASALLGDGLAPLLVSGLSGHLEGASSMGRSLAAVCLTSSLIAGAMFAFGRRFIHSPVSTPP